MYNDYNYNRTGWNWNGYNNMNQMYSTPTPHYEIVKVNGIEGAKSFQMAPNSSLFLADATNPNLIWLVQTDGAGYQTATPLDVAIHQEKPLPDVSTLEKRIQQLEEKYEQLNIGFSKQPEKQPVVTTRNADG